MFEAAVIGVSAGGMHALRTILSAIPETHPLSIVIVQHRGVRSDDYLVQALNDLCAITVKEAEDKEGMRPRVAYIAPADYHLLIELDRTFSLSVDEKVHYSRPSIDVLFESAAETFASKLIGVILTGGNSDGAQGLRTIKQHGGLTVVQDPETAEAPSMPRAALRATAVDHVASLERIGALLRQLGQGKSDENDSSV
jgi:two-component system chemotaxis response regulator CheB